MFEFKAKGDRDGSSGRSQTGGTAHRYIKNNGRAGRPDVNEMQKAIVPGRAAGKRLTPEIGA